MTDRVQTVAVLRATGLGDLLTVVPSLRALRRAFPQSRVVLAAAPALHELAQATEAIDLAVPLDALGRLPPELNECALAVNLHGRGPQSHRVLLASRPRRLLAFLHPLVPETVGCPTWNEEEHEVLRWARLLIESGIACDPTRLDLAAPDPLDPRLIGATIIHPGGAGAARRWPLSRWIELARHETSNGRAVVVTGASSELGLAESMCEHAQLSPDANLAGRTTVMELASVVAHAGCVVSGDTGIAHLATAFATPSVLLFGPTPPRKWGPLIDGELHRVIWKGLTGDPSAAVTDVGLLRIELDDVLGELEALPRRAVRRSSPAAAG